LAISITITRTPSSGIIYRGQTVTLKATLTGGTGTKAYQWYKRKDGETSASKISGATSATYTPDTSVYGPDGLYYYSCEGRYPNAVARSTEVAVGVSITPAPYISEQPNNYSYYRGAAATALSVTASVASGALSYQWQINRDGSAWSTISGATSRTYTPLTNTVREVQYRCIVTNTLYGYTQQTTSNACTVITQATPTPSITRQPASHSYFRGAWATITVVATTSNGKLSYQWQRQSGSTWSNISGATEDMYDPPTSTVGSISYRCVVTNTLNGYTASVNSSAAVVTVASTPAPTISNAPGNATAYRGAALSAWTIYASSEDGTLSYQWQSSSDNSTWSNINGATKWTYTAPSTTVGTVYYRCRVTNTLYGYTASTNSSGARVIINATPAPTITAQSVASATYYRGAEAAQFSVTASSASGTLTYQWYSGSSTSNLTVISGATKSTYTPPTATVGTVYYRCTVKNTLNGYTASVNSNAATITVNATPVPAFTSASSLANASYYIGGTAKALNASATAASGTITYRWQSSANGSAWSNISATNATYTPPTTAIGTAYYRCIVTNTLNGYTAAATSASAKITVSDIPVPTFTRQPAAATYYRGAAPSALSVTASSASGTLSYQWQRLNGSTWTNISGETSTTYKPATTAVGAVSYRCAVTNSLNGRTKTAHSSAAGITVSDTPTPALTSAAKIQSAAYTPGDTAAALNATASSAAGTITYQWQKSENGGNFANVSGATKATYTPPTGTEYTAAFRCLVTNTLNGYTKTLTTDAATITVSYTSAPIPAFTSAYSVQSFTVYRGATVPAMNASATAEAGTITYQWQRSANSTTWTNISGATRATYSPPTATVEAVNYRCVVTNTLNGYSSSITTTNAFGTVLDTPAPAITSAATFTVYDCVQGEAGKTLNAASTVAAGALRYQWQTSADGTEWTDLTGAASSAYKYSTLTTGTQYLRCAITNTLNGYTAQTVSPTATVNTTAAQAVTITQSPQGAAYTVGDSANALTVSHTGGNGPEAYQWQQSANGSSWSFIGGANGSTYKPSTDTAGSMYYRVQIISGYTGYTRTAVSAEAEITVNVGAPVITAQPQSAEYFLRGNAQPLTVTAKVYGNSVLSYQWQRSDDGSTFADIPGATASAYTPRTYPFGTVYYRAIVTAANNGQMASAASAAAAITIGGEGQAPIFERRLANAVYQYGDTIIPLNGTASSQDTNDITYQWYWSRDNETFFPITGAVQPVYTPASDSGGTYYYYVIATAHFASGTVTDSRSNTATIIIVNEQSNFGSSWRAYLKALKTDFVKLARLEFLQPDGSVAFALDNNPKNRRSGAFIQSGNITVNLQNGARRTATVTLANLDNEYEYNVNKVWFGQQIMLSEGLILPSGEEFYLPQGVFYIKDPEERVQPDTKTVTYHLVDKWSYLDGTLFGNLDGIYEIPRGTNIFTAIQSLLDQDRGNGYRVDAKKPVYTDYYNGQTSILPDGTFTPDTNLPYTYRNDAETGTYADIVLEMANILAAWVGYDAAGRLRIDPSQDDVVDASKPVQWEFYPTEKQFLGATYTVKNSDVYNDIIIVGESLTDYGYTAGRAQNIDPTSDTNINIIGKKTLKESSAGFYTEKQCENLAVFKLKRFTVLQKSVTIQSAQLFHISENQLVTIRRPDKEGNPVERHLVVGFTRPLAQTGPMQINATSVNDLPTATILYPGGQTRSATLLVGAASIGTSTTVYSTAV